MLWIRIIQGLLAFIIVGITFTQILWPFITNRPTWLLFRKEFKLREQLAELNQADVEGELQKTIDERQKVKPS